LHKNIIRHQDLASTVFDTSVLICVIYKAI